MCTHLTVTMGRIPSSHMQRAYATVKIALGHWVDVPMSQANWEGWSD